MGVVIAFLFVLAVVSTICTKGTDKKRRGKWW
jgi:Na+-transporting methylmalonyl-CoA/oxaloacetate decarboxylase gamma subunit